MTAFFIHFKTDFSFTLDQNKVCVKILIYCIFSDLNVISTLAKKQVRGHHDVMDNDWRSLVVSNLCHRVRVHPCHWVHTCHN